MNRIVFRAVCVALAGLMPASVLLAQSADTATTASKAAPVATTAPAAQKAKSWDQNSDWGWLGRYKEADLALAQPAAGEDRVVFMGDSITQGWKIEGPEGFFPGKPYLNRGISGQTTPQMLLRFRQDVIDLKPKVVVILAGTNDIAGNTGPETLEQIEGNLATMAELATVHQIRVVLCSVTPAFDYPWRPGRAPAEKIVALNAWIKAYAAEHGDVYVDFHSAMKGPRDGLRSNLGLDGVHPNPAGYAVMTPLVEAGIEQALKK